MENYLKLTAAEFQVYNELMATLKPKEKEDVLVLTNPWLEEGKERGKEEGLVQGLVQGAQSTVIRILNRRFGVLPVKIRKQIQSLSGRKLDKLADAVLDLESLDALKRWLTKNA